MCIKGVKQICLSEKVGLHQVVAAVLDVCMTGNADDIGNTCAHCYCWIKAETSPVNPASSTDEVLRWFAGFLLVLGVAGTVGTSPIYNDGTQPQYSVSPLTAYDQWLYLLKTRRLSSFTKSNSSSPFFL